MSALNLFENGLRSLWVHFTGSIVAKVPSCDSVCEFQCRETECSIARWRTCERRLARVEPVLPPETLDSKAPSCVIEGHNHNSVSHATSLEGLRAALQELGSDYQIRNVLVFRPPAPPLKRTEVYLDRPECKHMAASVLAAALHAQGFTVLNVKDGQVPVNEIWLTIVAGDGLAPPTRDAYSSWIASLAQCGNVHV